MYYFKIDPKNLDDDAFFDLCARVKFINEIENKRNGAGAI